MPHISIKVATGKTEEQKRELSARIVQDVIDVLHVDQDAVSLAIEEVEPQDWTEQIYRPEIQAKWDKLYKIPGYDPK